MTKTTASIIYSKPERITILYTLGWHIISGGARKVQHLFCINQLGAPVLPIVCDLSKRPRSTSSRSTSSSSRNWGGRTQATTPQLDMSQGAVGDQPTVTTQWSQRHSLPLSRIIIFFPSLSLCVLAVWISFSYLFISLPTHTTQQGVKCWLISFYSFSFHQ